MQACGEQGSQRLAGKRRPTDSDLQVWPGLHTGSSFHSNCMFALCKAILGSVRNGCGGGLVVVDLGAWRNRKRNAEKKDKEPTLT